MFGKIMSIPDSLILNYLGFATTFDATAIADFKNVIANKSINPMEVKKAIGLNVVTNYWAADAASEAAHLFKQGGTRASTRDWNQTYRGPG